MLFFYFIPTEKSIIEDSRTPHPYLASVSALDGRRGGGCMPPNTSGPNQFVASRSNAFLARCGLKDGEGEASVEHCPRVSLTHLGVGKELRSFRL